MNYNNFNGGFGQPQQMNPMGGYNNTQTYGSINNILGQLQNLIIMGEQKAISSEQIRSEIIRMVNQGLLTLVGEGTNRIVVELNYSIDNYITFNGAAVIKIPYSTTKGLDDNLRELLFYDRLSESVRRTGNADAIYLLDRLPAVSQVKGYPCLIAQEKIIPINRCNEITAQNLPVNKIAGACIQLIYDKYFEEQRKLLSTLDQYAIFADLNPLTTPFQYGFKIANGRQVLSILDTGYVIPKFLEFQQLVNAGMIENRRYGIIGRDFGINKIKDNDGNISYNIFSSDENRLSKANMVLITPIIYGQMGVYLNNTPNAQNNVNNPIGMDDMSYFKKCYSALRRYSNSNPTSESFIYFNTLRNNKGIR